MLNYFVILSKGGIVLWLHQFSFVSTAEVGRNLDHLIGSVFFEHKQHTSGYNYENSTVKFAVNNLLDLIFVAVHHKSLYLDYVSDFLVSYSNFFSEKYGGAFESKSIDYAKNFAFEKENSFETDFLNILSDFEGRNKKVYDEEKIDVPKQPPPPKQTKKQKQKKAKEARSWNSTNTDAESLDFSAKTGPASSVAADPNMFKSTKTTNTKKNEGAFKKLFSSFSTKTITDENIAPVLAQMREHLCAKNVAYDIADSICESIRMELVDNRQLGTFETVYQAVKKCTTDTLSKILIPPTHFDLNLLIQQNQQKAPFSIVFCGVNGVGKSTNLAKIAFHLMNKNYSILIAACDTFRSGAVEQLKTHAGRLTSFFQSSNKVKIEVFEKGYGKDAAGVAKEAISYARNNDFDVVLVDTAGRMQDNEPLMRSLAKLVATNSPNLVLFVGEALVGNDGVDQLKKFDKSLSIFLNEGAGKKHSIDGIVLTKFDTIDDKVGAAISMTYLTGKPIVFVGVGQTYSDLTHIDVDGVVSSLMS